MRLKGFTRTGRLSAGLITGLSTLLLACGQPDFYLSAPKSTQNPYQALSQKYGPIIRPLGAHETHLPWWFVVGMAYQPAGDGRVPDPTYLDLNRLDQELSKYPKDFFRYAPVDSILWVRELKGSALLGGIDFAGMGFALFNQRRVFIESGAEHSFYALHHEIFHAVDDFAIFGNPQFLRCNPEGFKYRSGVRGWGDYPQPGFVSSYALNQAAEDQAEVAAMMIASPQSAQLLASWIANGDTVLACKRDAIQDYLEKRFAGFTRQRFNLLMLGLRGSELDAASQNPAGLETLSPDDADVFDFARSQSDAVRTMPFSLPAAIGSLTGLKQLDLSQSYYTDLPAELGQLKQLESLILDSAFFKELPQVIRSLSSLKKLSLSGSRLSSAAPLPQKLTSLTLSFGAISSAELEAFLAAQSQLMILNLRLEQQLDLPAAIQHMKHLQTLNIYGPQILRLPDWLPGLKALRSLKLSALSQGVKIELISQLKQLKELEISDSSLSQLPDLSQLQQLQTLILTRNNLTELPSELLNLPALKKIRVDDNSLEPDKLKVFRAQAEAKGIDVQCPGLKGCSGL